MLLAPLNALSYLTEVGSKGFIEKTKAELGIGAKARRIRRRCEAYELREPPVPYGEDFDVKNGCLRLENTYLWNIFPDISNMIDWPDPKRGGFPNSGTRKQAGMSFTPLILVPLCLSGRIQRL